jgi:hypothetical protein
MDQLLAEIAEANSSAQATVTVTATASQSTGYSAAETTLRTSSSLNLGTTIGAAVGVPLGVLAIGLIGFLFWRERKHGKANPVAQRRATEMDGQQTLGLCARNASNPSAERPGILVFAKCYLNKEYHSGSIGAKFANSA